MTWNQGAAPSLALLIYYDQLVSFLAFEYNYLGNLKKKKILMPGSYPTPIKPLGWSTSIGIFQNPANILMCPHSCEEPLWARSALSLCQASVCIPVSARAIATQRSTTRTLQIDQILPLTAFCLFCLPHSSQWGSCHFNDFWEHKGALCLFHELLCKFLSS